MTTIIPPPTPTTKGQPWSHHETLTLLDAYESKWYSLNRGPLKSPHWDAVSSAVASSSSPLPPKTGTQCRHKIEKLRKRYRAEKGRPSPSFWPYFDRIDRMERGPVPIAVKAPDDSPEDSGGGSIGIGTKGGILMEVATEVRRLGEGMVRVEKRRMEMMREVERDWFQMEAKRAQMVVGSQAGILESIAGAFAAMKRARKAPEES